MSETTRKTATDTPLKAKKIKPTLRQRKLARIAADVAMGRRDDITTSGELVLAAGYAATVKEVPHKILDTSGVRQALSDIGFDEESAKNVVKSILENAREKASDRLKAADMVFKVHGTYAAEKHVSLNIDANVDTQAMLELAERLRNTTQ
jgi:hypothetical protein